MPIPKIVHQMAPAHRDLWHPVWKICHKTWLTHFPKIDYECHMWNDNKIDEYIRMCYPNHYEVYKEFPFHIIKLDFARLAILHKFGGIYADMDFYCYENFYNDLRGDCILVQSYVPGEIVQNSLMIAAPNQRFFLECMDKCCNLFLSNHFKYDADKINTALSNDYIKNLCGSLFLSRCYQQTQQYVFLLENKTYNPHYMDYEPGIKTKHMLTGRWGKNLIDIKNQEYGVVEKEMSYQDFLKKDYKGFRDIDVDQFDFKKSYIS